MSNETKKRLDAAFVVAFGIMIGGNGYFIKRLVDEIYSTKEIAIQTREDVAVIKARLGIRDEKGVFKDAALRLRSTKVQFHEALKIKETTYAQDTLVPFSLTHRDPRFSFFSVW